MALHWEILLGCKAINPTIVSCFIDHRCVLFWDETSAEFETKDSSPNEISNGILREVTDFVGVNFFLIAFSPNYSYMSALSGHILHEKYSPNIVVLTCDGFKVIAFIFVLW